MLLRPEERPASAASRQTHLDWLRVVAFGILLLFHSAMPFTSFGWFIKDPRNSLAFDLPVVFTHEFRLQLLFIVSGAGLALAARSRGVLTLARDRVKRLLIPLAFGMVVTLVPHAYFEHRFQTHSDPGFFEFWEMYLKSGPEPRGLIGWKHLWFLAYLLPISLFLLPLARAAARGGAPRGWGDRMGTLPSWALLCLMPLPWILIEVLLRRYGYEGTLWNDPAGLVQYTLYVILGIMAAVSPGVLRAFERARWVAFWMGIPTFILAAGAYFYFRSHGHPRPDTVPLVGAARALNTSMWVIFFGGTARRYGTSRPAWLAKANQFVYPCYVVHQVVIVAIAFFVVGWSMPIGIKFVLIVVSSTAATLGIALLAARVPFLGPCLGYWPRRSLADESPPRQT